MSFFGRKENSIAWRLSGESTPGRATRDILSSWVRSLPSGDVIDLAAGQGIESKYISSLGRGVAAFDKDESMVRNSIFKIRRADILNLDIEQNSVAGILIKDAWVFFDKQKRRFLLSNFRKSLRVGGSILVMSQWSDTRAHIKLSDSNYPIRLLKSDFNGESDWLSAIQAETTKGGQVLSIEYSVNERTFASDANAVNMSLVVDYYDTNSSLARENRWRVAQQYVAKFSR